MTTPIPSPCEQYRLELAEHLLALAPASVLDAGCGAGDLLLSLAPRVARAAGFDRDPAQVEAARARGLDVREADVVRLPYADREFDWVVLQNSAHHLPDLDAAMRECWRVARVGLLVQDPWYDEAFVSQRIALALDRWFKQIDRLAGMVHEDVLDAARIAAALAGEPGIAIEVRHRLLLQPLPFDEVVRAVDQRLRSGQVPPALETEARAILEDAERHGASEPGTLLLSLRRPA